MGCSSSRDLGLPTYRLVGKESGSSAESANNSRASSVKSEIESEPEEPVEPEMVRRSFDQNEFLWQSKARNLRLSVQLADLNSFDDESI